VRKRVYVVLDENGEALGVFWSIAHADWCARELFELTTWVIDTVYLYGEPSNELA
jgi:hypothetical protein